MTTYTITDTIAGRTAAVETDAIASAVFLAVTFDRTAEQTADILDQLNTYEADNEFTANANIWADVIDHLDPIDDGYGADESGMDRFELSDGRRFRWDRSRDIGYRWGEA